PELAGAGGPFGRESGRHPPAPCELPRTTEPVQPPRREGFLASQGTGLAFFCPYSSTPKPGRLGTVLGPAKHRLPPGSPEPSERFSPCSGQPRQGSRQGWP